jgi:hypothetical protein
MGSIDSSEEIPRMVDDRAPTTDGPENQKGGDASREICITETYP